MWRFATIWVAGCSFSPQRIDSQPSGESDAPLVQPDAAVCPVSYDVKFAQHSYRILDDQIRSFPEATAECASDGGHLIKIDDAAENAEVERQMEAAFNFSFSLWIGLSDPTNTAAYQWFDGTQPATFVNWDQVPSAANGDCVTIRSRTGGGRWFTGNCDTQRIAVCECPGL